MINEYSRPKQIFEIKGRNFLGPDGYEAGNVVVHILPVEGYEFAIMHVIFYPAIINPDMENNCKSGMADLLYDGVYSGYLFLNNKPRNVMSIKLHCRFDRSPIEADYLVDKIFKLKNDDHFDERELKDCFETEKGLLCFSCFDDGLISIFNRLDRNYLYDKSEKHKESFKDLEFTDEPGNSLGFEGMFEKIDKILWDVVLDESIK